MQFSQPKGHWFVPDGMDPHQALSRTTHLGIVAHPDDLEFMGWKPILDCWQNPSRHFSGVVASDGRSSPRSGAFAKYSDDQMAEVRLKEQRKAALLGEYSIVVSLMHPETSPVMTGQETETLRHEIKQIVNLARPEVIITHNLCDRHPHHVVVSVATILALRDLGPEFYPQKFYGGEVWRNLDWMQPADRLAFDVSAHSNLTRSLMGIFDSQISGGKRYDRATAARKGTNATYGDPFNSDTTTAVEFAMDLMPLLQDPSRSLTDYARHLIENFQQDVLQRIKHSLGG